MNSGKIGIFDSGVGGLTVVRAVNNLLPGESVVYFGDTARLPYGSKSPETVIRFAMEDAEFLLGKGIKLLVVACNTASSVSIHALREFADVPVVGVIDPGAKAAAGTTCVTQKPKEYSQSTISSGAYQKALKAYDTVSRVVAQPSPLLVPLVEEGWLEHRITEMVLREYATPLVNEDIDTLVLGCTHYPLLKTALKKILDGGIQLVDSAESTAVEVASILDKKGIIADRNQGENSFYVSDIPLKFQEIAQRFLGRAIPLVTHIEVGELH